MPSTKRIHPSVAGRFFCDRCAPLWLLGVWSVGGLLGPIVSQSFLNAVPRLAAFVFFMRVTVAFYNCCANRLNEVLWAQKEVPFILNLFLPAVKGCSQISSPYVLFRCSAEGGCLLSSANA